VLETLKNNNKKKGFEPGEAVLPTELRAVCQWLVERPDKESNLDQRPFSPAELRPWNFYILVDVTVLWYRLCFLLACNGFKWCSVLFFLLMFSDCVTSWLEMSTEIQDTFFRILIFILELIYDIFSPSLCIYKLSCHQINIEEN